MPRAAVAAWPVASRVGAAASAGRRRVEVSLSQPRGIRMWLGVRTSESCPSTLGARLRCRRCSRQQRCSHPPGARRVRTCARTERPRLAPAGPQYCTCEQFRKKEVFVAIRAYILTPSRSLQEAIGPGVRAQAVVGLSCPWTIKFTAPIPAFTRPTRGFGFQGCRCRHDLLLGRLRVSPSGKGATCVWRIDSGFCGAHQRGSETRYSSAAIDVSGDGKVSSTSFPETTKIVTTRYVVVEGEQRVGHVGRGYDTPRGKEENKSLLAIYYSGNEEERTRSLVLAS